MSHAVIISRSHKGRPQARHEAGAEKKNGKNHDIHRARNVRPRAESREQQSPFISAIGRQDEAASATSGEPITFYWLIGTHFKFAPRKVALDKD